MRIYFRGELGSGKSTLIRGLLHSLGVEAREFTDAGLADYFQGDGVCLVEWPERAGDALPEPDLELTLAYSGTGRAVTAHAQSPAGERCLALCRTG
jgi:tRNA threonylcarbamoyladenosine biosynthesis protein TsaE